MAMVNLSKRDTSVLLLGNIDTPAPNHYDIVNPKISPRKQPGFGVGEEKWSPTKEALKYEGPGPAAYDLAIKSSSYLKHQQDE